MASIGVFEAKNRLSELVERAARGEEITITRRGEIVARLVPPANVVTGNQAVAAIEALRQASLAARLDGESLQALRETGRR